MQHRSLLEKCKSKLQGGITSHQLECPSSKNLPRINSGEGVEKKGTLLNYWWECKLIQPLCRAVQRFHKKLKIELSYDSANPLLCVYQEKIIIKKMHAPQCSLQQYLQYHGSNLNSINWGMDEETVAHIYNEILCPP